MYRFITFILVFGHINIISSESIPIQTWSNIIQDLSLKIHDYKSDDKIIESHPLNEGFILLADNPKKPLPTRTTTKSPRITKSQNISSTTCKTIIMVKIKNRTSPPVGHLGRRLLNEPSYDTDTDTSSMQTPVESDEEFNSFLKVDNDELSKQLFKFEVTAGGSGETTEDTTEQTTEMMTTSYEPTTTSTTTTSIATGSTTSTTTTISIANGSTTSTTTTTSIATGSTTSTTTISSTTPAEPEQPILSNTTIFILELNCTDADSTLNEILDDVHTALGNNYNPIVNNDTDLESNCSGKINVTVTFITGNNVTIINNIYAVVKNITKSKGVDMFGSDTCGHKETVSVTDNVTSCYLINLCNYCGINPRRGVCLPENPISTCRCFNNEKDPSRPYAGEFCLPSPVPAKPQSIPSRWTPIIVGILSGLTGLFFAITCCLWTVAVWRHRRLNPGPNDIRIRRVWHLPRAQMPIPVRNENFGNDLNNTISTSASNPTDSDYNRSNTTDSTFFKELDKKMGENLRSTITRPNTQAMLASLPSDTISTLSSYDPIDELDSIIDNEDVNTTFHDPLNDLFDDNEILEIRNPNLKLPRPNVDLNPTGLFSYFYKK